jgi:hypothetical protein
MPSLITRDRNRKPPIGHPGAPATAAAKITKAAKARAVVLKVAASNDEMTLKKQRLPDELR